MDAGPLFDGVKSDEEKERGMGMAARGHADALSSARLIAYRLACRNGTVTVEDVAQNYADRGLDLWHELGMAAGSIFRGDAWEKVGTVKSTRVRSHSRPISVWRLMD